MKFFSGFCLIFFLLIQSTFGQDTSKILTPTTIQNLINSKSSQLQQLGITPTQIQNATNQILPELESGNNQIQAGSNQSKPQTPIIILNPADTVVKKIQPTQPQQPEEEKLPRSKIFGMDYFRNQILGTFNKSIDMQAPENYIIGVGDKIAVNVWGYSSFSSVYTVDETGSIFPSQTGKIYVKGLTYKDAQALIRSRFSTFLDLRNSQMEAILTYSRVIHVNIVGEVLSPGTYTMPATNTVFNALVAAQGPSNTGSLRKIYVKRNGQTVRTLDVYQFLLNPDGKEDYFLQDNDYIFVPPVNRLVTVAGEVLRPYEYELIENENLVKMLSYAGGLTSKAFTGSIQIQRYIGNELKLIDLNLDSLLKAKSDFPLLNGDQITINPLPENLLTWIKINGPVVQPGQFSFKEGEKLSDLFARNPLQKNALLDRGYIIRTDEKDFSKKYLSFNPGNVLKDKNSPDNLQLQNLDVINLFAKNNYTDEFTVKVSGAVRNAGEFPFGEGMTLQDILYYAGGLRPEAANNRIEVSRVVKTGTDKSVTPISVIVESIEIGKDLSINAAAAGFKLEPFDEVLVRTNAVYNKQDNITINGEILYPGTYAMLDKAERISSLIKRAGGLTQWSFGQDAILYRKNEDKGIVLMHLDRALKRPGNKHDFILRPGDIVTIPKVTNIVTLAGSIRFPFVDTLHQINVPYTQGKRAKFYVKKYGLGFNENSKRVLTYSVNNGQNVKGCHRFFLFNVYPKVDNGATVFVPIKPLKERKFEDQNKVDWNAAIENITVKLTAIATLAILLTRL